MLVLDGILFLQELRPRPLANQPIVLLGKTQRDIMKIQAAIEAGADEYNIKPFD